MRIVFAATRRGLSCISLAAIGLALASGCGDPGSSGSSSDDVCVAYYDAAIGDCKRVNVPDAEVNRLRPRFVTACRDLLAVPGEGATAAALKICATALRGVGNCSDLFAVVNECRFPRGSLAEGAACQDGGQCVSGACQRPPASADAGNVEPACGTCGAGVPAAVGQPCPVGTVGCVDGAACTAASPSTCEPVVFGGAGAVCDFATSRCKTGLLCDSPTLTCIALGGVGSACASTADCAGSLVCRSPRGDGTFQCTAPGASGAPCSVSSQCGKNLVCSSATSQCAPAVWASAGQPCGELMPCFVGNCPQTTPAVCPTVVADGQPCVATAADARCDAFAACLDGVCQLEGTPNCH